MAQTTQYCEIAGQRKASKNAGFIQARVKTSTVVAFMEE